MLVPGESFCEERVEVIDVDLGSISDDGTSDDGEVIAAADAAGIPMVFTSRRHFRH